MGSMAATHGLHGLRFSADGLKVEMEDVTIGKEMQNLCNGHCQADVWLGPNSACFT